MEKLYFEATPNSPEVEFRPDGHLYLKGRSIPEDTSKFYQPIINWCKKLQNPEIVFHIRMEYINTSSTKQLFTLFQHFDKTDLYKTVHVRWHYDEDDEDMLEAAEYFETALTKVSFEYIPCPEDI